MQNGYIESFNGRMRDELLNESLFKDLDQARQLIGAWITDYNNARPHPSLGYKTPAAHAGTLTAPIRQLFLFCQQFSCGGGLLSFLP